MFTPEYMRDRVAWLRETLIPDLIDAGSEATAEDFTMCADMIEQLLTCTCTTSRSGRVTITSATCPVHSAQVKA